MRSEMFMTSFILCSTRTTVRPAASSRISTHRLIRLLGTHARGGLVEEEQDRLGGQGDGDLEMALLAVREVGGELVGLVGEPDGLEDGQRPVAHLGEPIGARPEVERARVTLGGHPHVLEHGEVRKDVGDLVRLGDARAGTPRAG